MGRHNILLKGKIKIFTFFLDLSKTFAFNHLVVCKVTCILTIPHYAGRFMLHTTVNKNATFNKVAFQVF